MESNPLKLDPPGCCSSCGRPLDDEDLEGICGSCLWQGLFTEEPLSEPPNAASTESLLRIAGHEVLEEIARGGMGIVYRARQINPPRAVALKMLLPHQLSSPEMKERFRLEVRAIAGLEHPAILPVYQVGEQDGLPFFTMKLASGGTLATRRHEYQGRFKTIAQLMAEIAEAVQFAHDRGVLHRDLKPGNILFDEAGRPYVSDFGLAKFTQGLDGSITALTRDLRVLGTPQYMAPEVAAGGPHASTTAADVYSLGAILYELLAGRPPFEADSLSGLFKKIAEQEPSPITDAFEKQVAGLGSKSPVANKVPRDLGIISFKCLAKEPSRRYGSPRALAEDLRRWLDGQPITARPISKAERCWKWVQRNPVLFGLTVALVLLLSAGGTALLQSYHQTRLALTATRNAETQAQVSLRDALLAQAQALGVAHGTGQRWQALDALTRAARIQPSLELRNEAAAALARPDLKEVARFVAQIGAAGSSVVFSSDLQSYFAAEPGGGFARRSTANQTVLKNFPGTLAKPARWFVLSPDDRHIAALLDNYFLEIWAVDGDNAILSWPGSVQQPPTAEFHPNGHSLAGFVPGEGLFLQNLDGTHRFTLESTNARVIFLRFDPTGERLAAVRDPGGVEVWRCGSNPALLWTQPMFRAVPWLAWSPDGRQLMAAANDGRGLRILSAENGQSQLIYSRHLLYPRQFEFAPDGRTGASIGEDWVLRLWDTPTGQDIVTGFGRHRVMRFSRDGSHLTTAPGDHELAILQRAPELVFREFTSEPSEYTGDWMRRSPDNRFLLISYPQIRIYDTRRRAQAGNVPGPLSLTAKSAFFDPGGSAVLYSSNGKGMYRRLFGCRTNDAQAGLTLTWGEEEALATHPDGMIQEAIQSGQTWVYHRKDGIEIWPAHDPKQARRVGAVGSWPTLVTSENGNWMATAKDDDRIEVRAVLTGQVVTNLPIRRPDRVWFSPDSQWLLASNDSGYASWQSGTWKPGVSSQAHLNSGDPGLASFSDDSRLLVVRQEREVFRLLSFPECRELVTLKPPLVLPVRDACLSSDGKRLWLLAANYRVFEWDLAVLRQELGKLALAW